MVPRYDVGCLTHCMVLEILDVGLKDKTIEFTRMNKIGGGYAMYWFKPIEIHSKRLRYLYTRKRGYATRSFRYWSVSNLP